jgi:thioredoxin-related protein
MRRLDKLLDRSANILLIVVCLIVSARVASNFFAKHQFFKTLPQVGSPKSKGVSTSVGDIRPKPDLGGVLLFVSPTCHYCEQSLPFYRVLAKSLSQTGMTMLIAIVDQSGNMSGESYIVSRDLPQAVPVNIALNRFGITATPTLLAYNANGGVTGSWTGLLNQSAQQQVAHVLALSK